MIVVSESGLFSLLIMRKPQPIAVTHRSQVTGRECTELEIVALFSMRLIRSYYRLLVSLFERCVVHIQSQLMNIWDKKEFGTKLLSLMNIYIYFCYDFFNDNEQAGFRK